MMKREVRDDCAKIGKMLQKARESRKVLQSEMAATTELTKNHISAIERGVSMANVKTLLGYCKKLEMTPDEILEFTKNNIGQKLLDVLSSMSPAEQEKVLELIQIMKK